MVGLAAGWYLHALVRPPAPAPAIQQLTVVDPVAMPPPSTGSSTPPRTPGPETTESRAAAFDDVYKTAKWGKNAAGEGISGSGSSVKSTAIYRAFLADFMKDTGVTSVVDAGCGDWNFSQLVDWTGIDYKGYDIVGSLIEKDKQKFGKPNIQFFQADIVEADLPPADLLVSKHVLQHLPNADVQKFLAKQLPKYKHVLLTDGVVPGSLSSDNHDIAPGDYRPLDPTKPPFNIPGVKALTWWDAPNMTMHQIVYIPGKAVAEKQKAPR